MIRVLIIGANGRMGKLVCAYLKHHKLTIKIVAQVNSGDNLKQVLLDTKPDIALELTNALSVQLNTSIIIDNNIRPIIIASGLTKNDIDTFSKICLNKKLGGMIIPNLSVGMAIINKMLPLFRKYYSNFAIVEYHHKNKIDKPSGTAKHSAGILGIPEEQIASLRSDNFVAKQQIYIGSREADSCVNERILFDHETFDRSSFMAGILLAINTTMRLESMIVGLEQIIE